MFLSKIKKINSTIILFLFLLLSMTLHAEVVFKAKLDSATLLMGNQTLIHIEIQQDATQKGKIINEPEKKDGVVNIVEGVEFGGIVRNDTTEIGLGRKQINRDYIIQSFDSGVYIIPPFKYVIGVDTFKSKELTLNVVPVKLTSVDLATDTITTFAPIEEVDLKMTDYIPDALVDYWFIWVIILILLLAISYLLILYKKNGNAIFQKKKIIPPYELAKQKLQILKQRGLCQEGKEKEYYSSLTNILREYLAGRFGILAQEMTTTQILDAVNSNEEISKLRNELKVVLEIADFVKFAKAQPSDEENINSFQIASNFVEITKPIVIDDNDTSSKSNNKKKMK